MRYLAVLADEFCHVPRSIVSLLDKRGLHAVAIGFVLFWLSMYLPSICVTSTAKTRGWGKACQAELALTN